jgi:hypothetical protein
LFWPSSLYYSGWIRFAPQIERYRDLFPANRLKVVIYDDFRHDNLATFAEVAAFAGLDTFRPEPRQVNENQSPRSRQLTRAFAVLGDLPIKNVIPVKVRHRLRRLMHHVNRKPEVRAPLDPSLRRDLMKRFRPDVEALSRLLGRDLVRLWGYEVEA